MLRHLLRGCVLTFAVQASAQDCGFTSIGLLPLPELGTGTYQGWTGGLYPGGSNVPPAAHLQAGLLAAAAVQPRDGNGQLSPNGSMVLLSIGMSNTTQEFSAWQRISAIDGDRNPRLVVVDGAQGSQDAAVFANPNAQAWTVVDQRLAASGVTAAQVQVVWLKQALMAPPAGFPAHVLALQSDLQAIAQNLRARFPNLRICYLSSRTYGGYAFHPDRKEPLSFETGFAVQRLIAAQIAGDPALNHDPAQGSVMAPWLAWGPYLWADGVVPRADGLAWYCADYQDDGIHPKPYGRHKVALLLDAFFRSEPTAVSWYLGGSGVPIPAVLPIGSGCTTPRGVVGLLYNSLPRLGNSTFALGANRLTPGLPAVLAFADGLDRLELVRGCELYLDLNRLWPASLFALVGASGTVQYPVPIPSTPSLAGLRFYAQWACLDPVGAPLPSFGVSLWLGPAGQVRIGP